jgi:hypothetical protein
MITRREVLVRGVAGATILSAGQSQAKAEVDVATAFGFQPSPADNGAAETRMRDHALAHPGSVYCFPGGATYDLSTPRFLYGVEDIEINAYGAAFRNTNAGKFGYADVDGSFYVGSGSVFHPMTPGNIDPRRATSGHLIDEAEAGDRRVRVQDPQALETFEVGGWVLLHWFSRQSVSFPPNPAYFEYAAVVAMDPGKGHIELDRPLQHSYRTTAPDHAADAKVYGTTTGRARILSLDRPDYRICKRFVLRGGRGIAAGVDRGRRYGYYGIVSIAGALHVELHDVEFNGFFPSMAREVLVNGSRFTDSSELDKLIERIEMRDCEIANIAQGAGVRRFEMTGGKLTSTPGRRVQSHIRARDIALHSVEVRSQSLHSGAAQLAFDAFAMDTVSVESCTFHPATDQGTALTFGGEIIFTPLAVTDATITIAHDDPRMEILIRAVDVGSSIVPVEAGGEGASKRGSTEAFFVTAITFTKGGDLVLHGSRPMPGSDELVAMRLLRVRNFVTRGNALVVPPPGYRLLRDTRTIASFNGQRK